MPSGQFDSSKTRVAPVCAALREHGGDWVRQLLALGSLGSPTAGADPTADLTFISGALGPSRARLTATCFAPRLADSESDAASRSHNDV
jgi:hypothetical protein